MTTKKSDYQEAIDRAFNWIKSGHRTRDDKIEYLRALKDEQTAFRVVAVLEGDYSKVSESYLG